jgi:small neutral amino acid transporter SnatA (MarC family)
MDDLLKSSALMLALLNPFLVIVYLVDLVEKLDRKRFAIVLINGSLIATVVFCAFAVLGDVIF